MAESVSEKDGPPGPGTAALEPFFAWLQSQHGWAVDLHDRRRISRVLQAETFWTVPHLGQVLAAVLAHDPDQWGEFHRHFGAFFAAESYGELRPHPLDRPALVAAFCSLQVEPAPSTPNVTGTSTLKALEVRDAAMAVEVPRSVSPSTPAMGSAPSPLSPASASFTPSTVAAQSPPPALFRIREVSWPASAGSRPSLDWDPDGPRQFFLADVGPPPEPLLSSALLDHLADAMGYFRSQWPSAALHVDETIRETVRAGYPVLRFLPGREVCRLLLLEDTWAEARAWNTVPQELAEGLAARGVPVTHGLFDGLPVRFRLADGAAVCDLEDWENQRAGLLVLLFTEGKGFYRRRDARALEDLACWPRLAWIDFREPRLWDACTRLAIEHGLAVFSATAEGLWAMSRALLTEQGRPLRSAAVSPPPDPDLPLAQRVERLLDDALPWAELCALLPSVPYRLGDALRRRFHPQLPPTHFARLGALPATGRDAEGLHFDGRVRQVLCCGFWARRSETDRRAVLGFVEDQLQATGRLLPADSLARYACEGIYVRLALWGGTAPDTPLAARLVNSNAPVAESLRVELKQDTDLLDQIGRLSGEQSRLLQKWRILKPRASPYPDDMVCIPAGPFRMGDPTEEGYGDERPQHEVYVSTFYLAKHPVTWQLWQDVHGWAVEHGYQFDNRGAGRGTDHPVTNVSWHDAVKWCNALSEKDGRRPAYYMDASQTEKYRRGRLDLPAEAVDWTANGYRLPTEAEWEKAARGGLEGHRYPWYSKGKDYERFISRGRANYHKSQMGGTTPVGRYPPNGYGLFDMAGNVYDWIWDRWDRAWYRELGATTRDTRGPDSGMNRVSRGGSWWYDAWLLRCAYRYAWHPSRADADQGFRLAGGQAEPPLVDREEGGEPLRRLDGPSEPPESSGAEQACLTIELVPPNPAASARGKSGTDFPSIQDRAETRPMASELETVRLTCAESSRELPVDEPVVLDAGACRVTAARPFCWPAATTHELECGKAYLLRILMRRQPPPGMVEIPAGTFQMGDPTNEGDSDERPMHEVFVGSFFIAQHQVTWGLWREVYDWALGQGYQFENRGGGYGDDHPVHSVNWCDVVQWCNAYSERQGRDPAYFEDRIGGIVYRQGDVNLLAAAVDWKGQGFRLPTEAEWEKAARGGLVGHHYPWESSGAGYGGYISADKANYDASNKGRTTAIGSYPANGYQLYDMAGNVWEWCWDWWDEVRYLAWGATDPNTSGPDGSVYRVCRGGCWRDSSWILRCAYRSRWLPSDGLDCRGFRLAAGQVEAANLDEGGERG